MTTELLRTVTVAHAEIMGATRDLEIIRSGDRIMIHDTADTSWDSLVAIQDASDTAIADALVSGWDIA